ncbi:MAG: PIN domain-containing protein [Nitrospira sp.]|nr:PIN domain-containing protein [Nitrospira sp.]
MDRVFLDANVLFSAAYRVETPLRTLFTMPRAQLVTSAYALEEARRNLSSGQQQAELERLCRSVEVVSVLPPQGELSVLAKLPENDRPILWAAISVRATHLLSGDFKAFGCLYGQTINGVSIMPPAVYLKGHRR